MKKIKTKLFLIIATVIVLVTVFILYPQFKPKIKNKPNIILIILDCLRADHLGCYGYTRNTSPNIDDLAENGLIFSNAFSQGGYTLASIPSIFTSKFPLSHGVFINQHGDKLGANETTLAEILKNNGYVTVGFTGGGYTSHIYGFSQGFDIYKETDWGNIKEVSQLASDWLEKKQKKPFFLFLHCYTIHDPFDPPKPFNEMYDTHYNGYFKGISLDYILFKKINSGALKFDEQDTEYIISQYDGNIRYCDEHLGRLFKKIEALKLASNTIVILTSDHGEDLMDHGTISHGDIYDVDIHVPLIIRYPYLFPKNKKIGSIVRSIDIMPTILDILALPLGPSMEGKSLFPLMSGKKDKHERMVFSFGNNPKLKMRIALRTKNWKLIYSYETGQDELYNLEKDPKELNNLASVNKQQLATLQKKLNNYIKRLRLPIKKDGAVLDEKTRQQLKSLGYVQ